MATVRMDKNTGIWYSHDNIPLGKGTGKSGAITSVTINGEYYIISNLNHGHSDDCWYKDTFCGDYYAVFKWVKTGIDSGYYHQITKWYSKYGWAKRQLLKIGKEN